MHLCLIDDDVRLLATMERGLRESGHDCETFPSAKDGLARMLDATRPAPDVLLLDVMMPGVDGWALLGRLREAGVETPVIYLTARQEVDDRVRGLELGADDYMIKPFAFQELLARLQAVARRHEDRKPQHIGELTIHQRRGLVEFRGRSLELGPKEHALLVLLASRPGRTFPRTELLQAIWRLHFDPQTNVVDVLVARLRKRLGPEAAAGIETVVGEGYRMRVPGHP